MICNKDFKEIKNYFYDLKYEIKLSDSTINLKYYLTDVLQYERIINGRRFTKKIKKMKKIEDFYQISTSLRANYVHSQDSAFAR
jgi:hypothetical protein